MHTMHSLNPGGSWLRSSGTQTELRET